MKIVQFKPELIRNSFGGDDREKAEKHQKYEEKLREKDIEAYCFLLSDPRGRWFIRRLASVAFFDAPTFTGNSNSYFNDGRRSVVLDVVNDMKQADLEFHKLLLQAEIEELNYKEETSRLIKNQKKGTIDDE